MTFGIELDRSHPRKDGTCALRMTIHHRTLQRVSLEFTVRPEHFTAGKRVKGGKGGDPLAAEKNLKIERSLNEAMRIHLAEPGLSAIRLRKRLTSRPGSDLDFYALARQMIVDKGAKMRYNTKVQRLSVLRIVERMRPHLAVADFSPALLESIEVELLGQGLHRNTVTTKLKRLRTIWMEVSRGLNLPSPWQEIRLKTLPTKIRGHMPHEVELIRTVDLSAQPFIVQLHRDTYVLMFYLAGMRPGDICRLTDQDIPGMQLHYQMQKSSKILRFPIHQHAQEIIMRYIGKGPKWNGKRVILPLLRERDLVSEDAIDKRVNEVTSAGGRSMKLIAALCGLPPFSFYWARHSSSTKAILSGVGNRALQDMLGHSSSRETDSYAKRLVGSLSEEAYQKMHGEG